MCVLFSIPARRSSVEGVRRKRRIPQIPTVTTIAVFFAGAFFAFVLGDNLLAREESEG